MIATATRKSLPGPGKPAVWDLRLYVVGHSQRSVLAFANLKSVCEEHLPGRYRIEVIDVLVHPEVAKAEQIVAVPTVVRRSPKPVRTVIGDLSDTARLLARLDLKQ